LGTVKGVPQWRHVRAMVGEAAVTGAAVVAASAGGGGMKGVYHASAGPMVAKKMIGVDDGIRPYPLSNLNRLSGRLASTPHSGAVATAVICLPMSSSYHARHGTPCSLRRLNAATSAGSSATAQTTRLGCDLSGVKPKVFTAAIAAWAICTDRCGWGMSRRVMT
jgi:hypothetical protein